MESISEVERAVHAECCSGNFQRATEMMLASYGPELHGFVVGHFRGQVARGDDAFLDFCEDFWRALPNFQWRCTLRAWCYKLARSAAARAQRSPHEKRRRRLDIVDVPEVAAVVAEARTTTALYLQTAVKDAVRELRAELSLEDRELLTLRVDRKLSWREVAHVLSDEGEAGSDAEVARFEAALRQRFADVKKRLRRLAEEAGLL
jgi:RNA polymerase sigma-70 factor, ECF subfamily